ncbi:MAG: hypothetical protein MK358_00085 [Vicinamibacterales bacterium]|nr:hypothetical protein [Vicinamibacterales bacterium]
MAEPFTEEMKGIETGFGLNEAVGEAIDALPEGENEAEFVQEGHGFWGDTKPPF